MCVTYINFTYEKQDRVDSVQEYSVSTFAINLNPLSQCSFGFIWYNSLDKVAASTWRASCFFEIEMASIRTDVNSSASVKISTVLSIFAHTLF